MVERPRRAEGGKQARQVSTLSPAMVPPCPPIAASPVQCLWGGRGAPVREEVGLRVVLDVVGLRGDAINDRLKLELLHLDEGVRWMIFFFPLFSPPSLPSPMHPPLLYLYLSK